ncbi:MAG: hypothetical protein L0219_20410 [Phycisphaerales bacterium]|nr:hypothetical protein [Phycisphaerales bacterium]
MPSDFNWEAPPLSAEDQKLIEAYMAVGQPLDELPYTEAFDRIVRLIGATKTEESKHSTWKRLLYLRKRALLPRTSSSSGSSENERRAKSA